jgi:hypothetical protein
MTGQTFSADEPQKLARPAPPSPGDPAKATGKPPRLPSALVGLLAITLAVILIAPIIVDYNGGHRAPMAGAVALAALVTFASTLYYLTSIKGCPLAESIRHTIAATFLLVYLLLVIYNTFFNECSPSTSATQCTTVAGVTSTLLSNFTTLTGVVVAFYFGSITVEKVVAKRVEHDAASSVTSPRAGSAPHAPSPDSSAQAPSQLQASRPA